MFVTRTLPLTLTLAITLALTLALALGRATARCAAAVLPPRLAHHYEAMGTALGSFDGKQFEAEKNMSL